MPVIDGDECKSFYRFFASTAVLQLQSKDSEQLASALQDASLMRGYSSRKKTRRLGATAGLTIGSALYILA